MSVWIKPLVLIFTELLIMLLEMFFFMIILHIITVFNTNTSSGILTNCLVQAGFKGSPVLVG